MKSKTSTKIIIALVIFVVFMSVGFAVFSQVLAINGGGTLDYNWSVHFDSTFTESGIAVTPAPTIANDAINFNVTFAKPGETKTYVFKAVNDGTIDATLKSTQLTKGANNAAGITFSYSVGTTSGAADVLAVSTDTVATINKPLAKTSGVQFITVTMTYDATAPVETGTSKTATFALNFNYEQA
ncbi:MAG: hypothetical protein RSG95_02605 [Bacilli bacterium]